MNTIARIAGSQVTFVGHAHAFTEWGAIERKDYARLVASGEAEFSAYISHIEETVSELRPLLMTAVWPSAIVELERHIAWRLRERASLLAWRQEVTM